MPTFVLGPSKWRRRHEPAYPKWLDDFVPALWVRRGRKTLWPLDIRAAMVEAIRRSDRKATVMEAHERRQKETNTALFNRIVRTFGIDRFLVFWPAGAQRTGVDVELGFLLQALEDGRDPASVRVLVETAAGHVSAGRFESREKGLRSRYYEDLVGYGCPIVEWEDYEALWRALRHHSA